MIPEVARLTSLDIYRDGGSLSASFESKGKIECTLFFPIKRSETKKGVPLRTYNQPVIDKYTRNDYTSPVTGVISPDWKKDTTQITWEDAAKLLSDLKPFMNGFVSDYLSVFDEMQKIATNNGEYK